MLPQVPPGPLCHSFPSSGGTGEKHVLQEPEVCTSICYGVQSTSSQGHWGWTQEPLGPTSSPPPLHTDQTCIALFVPVFPKVWSLDFHSRPGASPVGYLQLSREGGFHSCMRNKGNGRAASALPKCSLLWIRRNCLQSLVLKDDNTLSENFSLLSWPVNPKRISSSRLQCAEM